MKIDHIGYAVKNIEKAVSDFTKLGFSFEKPIEDTDRNVMLAFGKNDSYCIELVSPLNKDNSSPIDLHLTKLGATPYHICYSSESLEEDIENLKSQGFKEVIPPHKAIAFDNRRVVFLSKLSMGLLEIVEHQKGEI